MTIDKYVETPEYKQICILRFLRDFARVPAKDIAKELEISAAQLSYIESGKREVDQKTIDKLSSILKTKIGYSEDLSELAKRCAADKNLIDMLSKYETKKGGFETVYKIAKTFAEFSASLRE